jgi:hypothetical protein
MVSTSSIVADVLALLMGALAWIVQLTTWRG